MAKLTPQELAQRKLERSMSELYLEFEKTLPKQRRAVKNSISAARPSDLSAEALEAVERGIYSAYSNTLRAELTATAYTATDDLANALIAALGPIAVMELVGIVTAMTAAELAKEGLLAGLVFALVFGLSVAEFAAEVAEAVMSRTSADGKNTRKRIRIFANEVAEDIQKAVNDAVKAGSKDADLLRSIDEVMREADWRVNRLVDTESMVAYRTSIARLTDRTDIFDAVRIIDFPEGHPDTHHKHACYKFARADEHGLGEGIYPASTRKIRNPHPQCRSILVPVLSEREAT